MGTVIDKDAKGETGKRRTKVLSAAFCASVMEPGRYGDGNGLMLKVEASGAKRWVQRIVIRGSRVDMGLGSFDLVPLAEARALAVENRKVARRGGDPMAERRLANATPTFAEAVDTVLAMKSTELANPKHLAQWGSTLATHAVPVLGRMKVNEVTTPDVLRVLSPIWTKTPETASRLRGRIEAVLDWATAHGHRSGENPARWKGTLEYLLAAPGKVSRRQHQPALSLEDAPGWFVALRQRDGMSARALEFAALTAARSGEVRGAVWSEFDLDRGLWTVPAARMKAKREHRVPLTPAAVDILRALPRLDGSPFVFFAVRGGMLSDMSLSAVMRRMQEAEVAVDRRGYLDPQSGRPAVPHGLRSTFRQWAAERGHDRDMAEMQLAHSVGSAVERAYQRADMLERRRAMMLRWETYLAGQGRAKVVRLKA